MKSGKWLCTNARAVESVSGDFKTKFIWKVASTIGGFLKIGNPLGLPLVSELFMSFISLSVSGHSTPIEKHVHFITFEGKIQAGGDFSKNGK